MSAELLTGNKSRIINLIRLARNMDYDHAHCKIKMNCLLHSQGSPGNDGPPGRPGVAGFKVPLTD